MPSVDKLNSFVFCCVHQGQDCVANNGEHLLYALHLETSYEEMGSGQLRHGPSWARWF